MSTISALALCLCLLLATADARQLRGVSAKPKAKGEANAPQPVSVRNADVAKCSKWVVAQLNGMLKDEPHDRQGAMTLPPKGIISATRDSSGSDCVVFDLELRVQDELRSYDVTAQVCVDSKKKYKFMGFSISYYSMRP